MTKLEKDITNISILVEKIKKQLTEKINSLPDNPRIHRTGQNGYSMSSKDLSADLNMSPLFYDFKRQYGIIATLIEMRPLEDIPNTLKAIITTGRVTYKEQVWRFHPDVITHLKQLAEQ
jgi:hypothetical protein